MINVKKKQRIGKRVPCFLDDDDGDGIASVAEILIQLPDLILHAQSSSSSSLAWGAKRRRSAISGGGGGTKSVVGGGAAASPATPLMFSPSESDDKANNNDTPSRVSPIYKRKNKDELMRSVTDLTHQKHSLVKEMEAAKRHLDVLRASNLELKHQQQVIIYGFSQTPLQTLQQQQQQHQIHYPFQLQHPSIQCTTLSSLPAVSKTGPVGLPDLNLTLEESASNADGSVGVGIGVGYRASNVTMVMDHNVNNRALASAQARKRRMQINKEKIQNQVHRLR